MSIFRDYNIFNNKKNIFFLNNLTVKKLTVSTSKLIVMGLRSGHLYSKYTSP